MASGIMAETKTATEDAKRAGEDEKPVQSGEPMNIEPDPSSQPSAPDESQGAPMELDVSLQGDSGRQTGGGLFTEFESAEEMKKSAESSDTEEITSPMEEELPSPAEEKTQEEINQDRHLPSSAEEKAQEEINQEGRYLPSSAEKKTQEVASPAEEKTQEEANQEDRHLPSSAEEKAQKGIDQEDRGKADAGNSQPASMEESKTSEVQAKTQDAEVHYPTKQGKCFVDDFVTVGAGNKKKVNVEPLELEIKRLRNAKKSWTEVLALVFGYRYDCSWNLKKLDSDEGFTFLDQKHYELLGDVILNYVQEVMREKYRLQELWIPEEVPGPKCNIFHSPDFFTNGERCLLLIQGAGAVRAGQWARSVCINAKLTEGTIFPALDYARDKGFSTIVFNPNYNSDPETRRTILGSESMEKHTCFVWKKYIRRCPAADLYIIAHSCGGMCTASILENFESDFVERVKAVAFTDSVHGGVHCSKRGKLHLAGASVDFVASSRPLKSFICSARDSYNGSTHVSSGHHKHEYTTGSAMPAIVEFFEGIRSTGRNLFL